MSCYYVMQKIPSLSQVNRGGHTGCIGDEHTIPAEFSVTSARCVGSQFFLVMKTIRACTTIMAEISFPLSCLSGPLVLAVSIPGEERWVQDLGPTLLMLLVVATSWLQEARPFKDISQSF